MTRPIRTAIVGFGLAGRVFHAPFLKENEDYRLVAVVTQNVDRARDAVLMFPDIEVFASIEALFEAQSKVDLVIVASPPASHFVVANYALDHGAAVVIDKPLAVTAHQGRQLIDAANARGLPLTVFQNRRWDGDFLTLKRLLSSGQLGTIHRFESRFQWWKPQLDSSWKSQTRVDEGGGILYDLGTHLIDQALQLFGSARPVYAELKTRRPGSGAHDDAFVVLEHASGVTSHLWMSAVAAQVGPRFSLSGSESAYVKWGLDPQEEMLANGGTPSSDSFGIDPESAWGKLGAGSELHSYPTEPGSYAGYYLHLADALINGGTVPVDPIDSVEVLDLIEELTKTYG